MIRELDGVGRQEQAKAVQERLGVLLNEARRLDEHLHETATESREQAAPAPESADETDRDLIQSYVQPESGIKRPPEAHIQRNPFALEAWNQSQELVFYLRRLAEAEGESAEW